LLKADLDDDEASDVEEIIGLRKVEPQKGCIKFLAFKCGTTNAENSLRILKPSHFFNVSLENDPNLASEYKQ